MYRFIKKLYWIQFFITIFVGYEEGIHFLIITIFINLKKKEESVNTIGPIELIKSHDVLNNDLTRKEGRIDL